MAVKASSQRDTYKATAVFLVLMGVLYLLDKWVHFSDCGFAWIMQKDTVLLYAAVTFLWFKSDKTVGIILAGVWLIQNISLVLSLLGQVSAYLLPLTLLLIGILLYWLSSK